jgi:hypothetical protein
MLHVSYSTRSRIMGARSRARLKLAVRQQSGRLPLRTWERLDNSPNQVGIRELGLIASSRVLYILKSDERGSRRTSCCMSAIRLARD